MSRSLASMKQKRDTHIKLIRTTVMLPEEMNASMRRLAEQHGRPFAWEVRRALDAHIATEEAKAA